MKICGIVAEFDPFHNGHKLLIEKAREILGDDTFIIAAMSGNFVQRGAPAVFNKHLRTLAALMGGADMIIELPCSCSLSTAEKFTENAVKILLDTGIVTHIAFGSECADIALLNRCVSACRNSRVDELIGMKMKSGVTFAAARQAAVSEIFGIETGNVLSRPNDILALGYLSAINTLGGNVTPVAVKREGANHNEMSAKQNIASASHIRQMIKSGEDFSDYVPCDTAPLYSDALKSGNAVTNAANYERAVLSRLRMLESEDFQKLEDISDEGLHNRIYSAVQSAVSLEELFDSVKTKRYTHARIRRLIFCAALGVHDIQPQKYLRISGFSKSGEELLKIMSKQCALPLVTSYSDAKKLEKSAQTQFEITAKQTDFYNLLCDKIQPCGCEYREPIVRI